MMGPTINCGTAAGYASCDGKMDEQWSISTVHV